MKINKIIIKSLAVFLLLNSICLADQVLVQIMIEGLEAERSFLESYNFKSPEHKGISSKEMDTKDIYFPNESDNFHDFQQASDKVRLANEISSYLKTCLEKKNIGVANESGAYLLFFKINEINYDDFDGHCYVASLSFRLEKDNKLIFENNITPKKGRLFGVNYQKALTTKELAKEIVQAIASNLKNK